MTDISTTYQSFNIKFAALKTLPINTKVCVDLETEILYIDTHPTLFGIQSTIRRFRNQTRDNLNIYLDGQFNEYKLFMNMVKDAYLSTCDNVKNDAYDEILELIKNIITFNIDITAGLQNIRNLYPDHPIQITIDTIFKTLLEYNKIYKVYGQLL